jgi:osmotically-inducible protein OsmY
MPEVIMKRTLILSLLSSALLLPGCAAVGIATGVGAVAGMTAAKEGGLRAGVNDTVIRTQISDLWFRKNVDMFRKLDLTVNQGRVLITGVVQNPEDRVEAVRLAWQPKGVKQVINEIRVGDGSTFQGTANDEWIRAQLRTRLIGNKDVQSINYSIEVVQGSVYLMGVAQNQAELDRVIRIAQKIKGVKEVISYVKMIGEPITSAKSLTSTPDMARPAPPVPVTPYDEAPGTIDQTVPAAPPPAGIESEVLPP